MPSCSIDHRKVEASTFRNINNKICSYSDFWVNDEECREEYDKDTCHVRTMIMPDSIFADVQQYIFNEIFYDYSSKNLPRGTSEYIPCRFLEYFSLSEEQQDAFVSTYFDKMINLSHVNDNSIDYRCVVEALDQAIRFARIYSTKNTPNIVMKALREIDLSPKTKEDTKELLGDGAMRLHYRYANILSFIKPKYREEIFDEYIYPKFLELSQNNNIGSRWMLLFEHDLLESPLTEEFVDKHKDEFSGSAIINLLARFPKLITNKKAAELICSKLATNVRDELNLFGYQTDVDISISVNPEEISALKIIIGNPPLSDDVCKG